MKHELRPYQNDVCREVWRNLIKLDHQTCLIQAFCGAGKTQMFVGLTQKLHERYGWTTLILAHRRELIGQAATRVEEAGINPGIIMAGEIPAYARPVQVGTIDTFDARLNKGVDMSKFDLVIVDEAHRAMGNRYQRVISHLMQHGAKIVGATATPIRTDGVGLGRQFESMVCAPQARQLQAMGFLCQANYFVGIIPDVSGVKLSAGDYNQQDLERVVNQKLLIGDIVENWLRHSPGRKTMAFASGIKHSEAITTAFRERGIAAAHIDGRTPPEKRDAVYHAVKSGEVTVVSNAQVYVEGTDFPFIECVIFARPTKSEGSYKQMGGRGMRTYEEGGKVDVNFHDHAGVVHAHGRVEDDRTWLLTDGKEMKELHRAERENQKVEFVCQTCGALFRGPVCPYCQTAFDFKGRAKAFLPADLVNLSHAEFESLQKPKKTRKASDETEPERKLFYQQVRSVAESWGKKPGWAAHVYNQRYKEFPIFEWNNDPPVIPTQKVENYCRSTLIRAAKGFAKEHMKTNTRAFQ